MRSLVLESSSSIITYYLPFVRSYDAIKYGFSPEEILEIRSIISSPRQSKDLEKDRSVKISFDRERLITDLDSGDINLIPAIDEIKIILGNENDPVTREISEIIQKKIDSEIKTHTAPGSQKDQDTSAIKQDTSVISVSPRGLNLIKKFEGFRATPYICPGGKLTIGYGNTIKEGEYTKITEAQAEALLRSTVSSFERAIKKAVKVPLTQNQYDALFSLAYNIGAGAFSSSSLVKTLNTGDYAGAADQFDKWVKSKGVVLRGLVRRRDEEKALFLS